MYEPIFLTIAGSHLYGTNRPDSDLDLRGVCFNPPETLLGLQKFEQYTPNKEEAVQFSYLFNLRSEDVVVYGLNKFFQLLLDCNPNIIELLFAKNLINSEIWDRIRDSSNLFLSNKLIHTFSGYAYSQLQRIKGHRRWIHKPPIKPNPEDYGIILTTGGGQTWTNSNLYNQYQSQLKDYNSYEIWLKERNKSRKVLEEKYGYDTKHAMHLCRLLLEAETLIKIGSIKFPFKDQELKYLLSVLYGEFDYDYIVNLGESAKSRLLELENISVLPKYPNVESANKLLILLNRENIKC